MLGLAWPGLLGLAWLGLAWPGLAWLGLAWLGQAWPGLASRGLFWLGLSWHGLAWLGPPPLFFVCLFVLFMFSKFLHLVVRGRGGVASIFGNPPFSDVGVSRFSLFRVSGAEALYIIVIYPSRLSPTNNSPNSVCLRGSNDVSVPGANTRPFSRLVPVSVFAVPGTRFMRTRGTW